MSDVPEIRAALHDLTASIRTERQAALHALQVVEFALTAPPPRRPRTWIHRVAVAVDALHSALHDQLPTPEGPVRLLDEIALCHPTYLPRVERLQQELLDLTIAVASLREQIEPEPTLDVDPAAVGDKLAAIAARFREHQAAEADLVFEATGQRLR